VTRPTAGAAASGQDAVLAALLRPASATPGDPIFMFINGISGESQDARHPMWSDLTGYHVSFSGQTSTGGRVGKAALGSFVVTMPYSLAVPPLLQALVTGKVFPAVKIQAATAGEVERNYLTITLGNARVASMTESSSGERPAETVSFAAAKFSVTYSAQNPDGSLGKTETFCFNFALQRSC
jgi:type VI protein secretion system component Hcp